MANGTLFIASITCSLCICSVGAAQTATPPQATPSENNDATLEEVVVTAQRRNENLQNVPITITAIGGAALAARGVEDTQDLAFVVPGLAFPSSQGTALPHLRGVGNSAVEPGVENSVALYIDGVYYATAAGSILSLNNIAEVEVLKGPQGTLFGRNATGGLIQITTKDPTQDFHGDASVGYANYNTTTLETYVTGGLTEHLAADLALQVSHQNDGYGTNFANGDQVYRTDLNLSARSKFLWTPSDSTAVRLSLDFEKSRGSEGFSEVPGTNASNIFYSRTPNLITLPSYDVNENLQPAQNLQGGGAALRVTQDLGFAQLVDITAYRQEQFYFTVDPDLGPSPFIGVMSNQADKQVSEELQLQSEPGKLRWTAGLYYFHAKDSLAPLATSLGGFFAAPVGPGLSLTEILINSSQTTNSIAGYGQATYEVLPGTNLTLGARITHESKSFEGSETGQINNVFYAPFGTNSDSFSVNKPSWRASLDHEFTHDVLGYVSYNRSFKSAGYNIDEQTNNSYNTEELGAYEIGVKSQFLDRRVRLNASAFAYNYDNIQVVRFEEGTAIVYNGASAKVFGADVDLSVAVTHGLTVSAGLEALRDYFTSFPCANYFAGGPNVSSPACTTSAAPTLPYLRSAAGNRLPYAPTISGNVGLDYTMPLFHGMGDFSLNDAVTGGYFPEPDNNLRQAGFNILNLAVKWSAPNDRYSVRLWTNNVTDKRYTLQLSSSSDEYAETLGPPRTYGITIGTQF